MAYSNLDGSVFRSPFSFDQLAVPANSSHSGLVQSSLNDDFPWLASTTQQQQQQQGPPTAFNPPTRAVPAPVASPATPTPRESRPFPGSARKRTSAVKTATTVDSPRSTPKASSYAEAFRQQRRDYAQKKDESTAASPLPSAPSGAAPNVAEPMEQPKPDELSPLQQHLRRQRDLLSSALSSSNLRFVDNVPQEPEVTAPSAAPPQTPWFAATATRNTTQDAACSPIRQLKRGKAPVNVSATQSARRLGDTSLNTTKRKTDRRAPQVRSPPPYVVPSGAAPPSSLATPTRTTPPPAAAKEQPTFSLKHNAREAPLRLSQTQTSVGSRVPLDASSYELREQIHTVASRLNTLNTELVELTERHWNLQVEAEQLRQEIRHAEAERDEVQMRYEQYCFSMKESMDALMREVDEKNGRLQRARDENFRLKSSQALGSTLMADT